MIINSGMSDMTGEAIYSLGCFLSLSSPSQSFLAKYKSDHLGLYCYCPLWG